MKKLLAFLLAFSLLFCLTACGDGENTDSKDNSDETSSEQDVISSDESTVTTSTPTNSSNPSSTENSSTTTPPTSSKVSGPTTTTSKPSVTGISNPSAVKLEKEYVGKVYFTYDAENIYAPGICFYNDGGYGEGIYCLLLDAMFTSNPDDDIKDRTPVTYGGKKYYRCGSGMSPAYVSMTSTEITITQDSTEIKAVLLQNGNLKITKSNKQSFPVNTELSISWNYLS